jgi:glucokinase
VAKTIGVVLSDRLTLGLVSDHRIEGPLVHFPEGEEDEHGLVEMHTDALLKAICEQVMLVRGKDATGKPQEIAAVGVAVPGIVRNGVIEDSPNIPQLKGARIQELLARELREQGMDVCVQVLNDADGVAAGLAAATGRLDQMLRVWTLGVGIGFGCYPFAGQTGEGGHTVVTLDERENFCGCGGRGHIEGIMGHRAMRLRFLDLEPEEVFAAASKGSGSKEDERCCAFARLWHRALAAGISSSIHNTGPGRFVLTGFNGRFVDLTLLKSYLAEMVKMSPLQGYSIEIVEDNVETRVIGSGVAAEQAAKSAC